MRVPSEGFFFPYEWSCSTCHFGVRFLNSNSKGINDLIIILRGTLRSIACHDITMSIQRAWKAFRYCRWKNDMFALPYKCLFLHDMLQPNSILIEVKRVSCEPCHVLSSTCLESRRVAILDRKPSSFMCDVFLLMKLWIGRRTSQHTSTYESPWLPILEPP